MPKSGHLVSQPLDFYAFNCYQNTVDLIPDPASYPECAGQGSPRTAIGWNITPDVLYYASKFWFERYGLPVLITENGFANNDFVMLDGKVYDPQRIDFLHRYLRQVARALEDGIPVLGYSYWSLFDNLNGPLVMMSVAQQFIAQVPVKLQTCLVDRACPLGQHPGPADGKTVSIQAHLFHQATSSRQRW